VTDRSHPPAPTSFFYFQIKQMDESPLLQKFVCIPDFSPFFVVRTTNKFFGEPCLLRIVFEYLKVECSWCIQLF